MSHIELRNIIDIPDNQEKDKYIKCKGFHTNHRFDSSNIDIIFYPCKHYIFCQKCFIQYLIIHNDDSQFFHCPKCQKQITNICYGHVKDDNFFIDKNRSYQIIMNKIKKDGDETIYSFFTDHNDYKYQLIDIIFTGKNRLTLKKLPKLIKNYNVGESKLSLGFDMLPCMKLLCLNCNKRSRCIEFYPCKHKMLCKECFQLMKILSQFNHCFVNCYGCGKDIDGYYEYHIKNVEENNNGNIKKYQYYIRNIYHQITKDKYGIIIDDKSFIKPHPDNNVDIYTKYNIKPDIEYVKQIL